MDIDNSTILFYPKCHVCDKMCISYLVTNLNDNTFNAHCRRCVPSGILKIDKLDPCISCDAKCSEIFVKIDDDNYCLNHFIKEHGNRRHSILIN